MKILLVILILFIICGCDSGESDYKITVYTDNGIIILYKYDIEPTYEATWNPKAMTEDGFYDDDGTYISPYIINSVKFEKL